MPDGAHYDVTIAGGGPAGSATALALKRRNAGLRVALVEKTDYAEPRVGETLPPPAQRLLMDLGVWDAFLRRAPLESSGSRAAWGGARFHDHEFIYSPYGRGWHVDRRDFDAMLVDEAERAGVDVFRKTMYRAGSDGNAFGARFLVDATGRRSAIARSRGARPIVFDQLVGVVRFLRVGSGDSRPDTYTAVEACEEGWWYTAALPNGDLAAIFMTDASLLRRRAWRTSKDWCGLMAAAPHTAGLVDGATPIGEPSVHPACSQRLDVFAGDGWLAVGDAASTFDPLSSQGVMKALRSGITASLAICRHLAGHPHALPVYGARLAKEFDHYIERRAEYYAMEPRWPDSPFWRCRQATRTRDEGGISDAVHVGNQHQEEPEAAGAGRL